MPITVLPRAISELIAAGEVIERPASVIKELVENSIDAGATRITVEIKHGGSTYMRITDDGCGIAPDEVGTAFLRHATSKISVEDDLNHIQTLGFRGEALASVAAVARVEVLTRQRGTALGTRYEIAGSIEQCSEQAGCPEGTTIVIRDLFFNVPVRAKFLKKDVTEGNAVAAVMQKIILSHPEIAFTFIRDNKSELHAGGDGTLLAAVYAVFGRAFAGDLLPVDYEADGISVKGYAVKPLYAKNNRSFQCFFVNGRSVKSFPCAIALEEAYRTLLMNGKFPACVLMLTVPPATVDVNVHPAKAEVRFSDEKKVTGAVYFAIKNALLQNGLIYEFQVKPPADWTTPPPQKMTFEDKPLSTTEAPAAAPAPVSIPAPAAKPEPVRAPAMAAAAAMPTPAPSAAPVAMASPKCDYQAPRTAPARMIPPEPETITQAAPVPKPQAPTSIPPAQPMPQQPAPEPLPPIHVIGEAFSNYILASAGDTLYFIDKHAAHERVLFEQFRDEAVSHDSQQILNGEELLLSMAEYDALEAHLPHLQALGFGFDLSHKPYAALTAVPVTCASLNLDELVLELAAGLAAGRQTAESSKQLEDVLHTMACKAAIRSGDKNAPEELQALAEAVWGNENIRHCPHGRPVLFALPKRELEKQFKRV